MRLNIKHPGLYVPTALAGVAGLVMTISQPYDSGIHPLDDNDSIYRQAPLDIQGSLVDNEFADLEEPNIYNPDKRNVEEYSGTARIPVFKGHEDPLFQQYDSLIMDSVDFWDSEFTDLTSDSYIPGYERMSETQRLDFYRTVKSTMLRESGGHRDSDFLKDPMQIANDVCSALRVLRDGGETSIPEGGYAELHGIIHTPSVTEQDGFMEVDGQKVPRYVQRWAHEKVPEGHRITPTLSIKYGVRWLFQKRNVFGPVTREFGDLLEHEVKSGDTLFEIARSNGTTVETIQKYTRLKDINSIRPSDVIRFRKATKRQEIIRQRSWKNTLQRYNGNATGDYAEDIINREAA